MTVVLLCCTILSCILFLLSYYSTSYYDVVLVGFCRGGGIAGSDIAVVTGVGLAPLLPDYDTLQCRCHSTPVMS